MGICSDRLQYAPVGYIYNADQYCLDCIAEMFGPGPNGSCAGVECTLDYAAREKGITDRYDESSYHSGDFPKSIPYFNDLHEECGPEHYGYGPEDPEWEMQYCGATCGHCHEVIDGSSKLGGPDVCPVFDNR